jgi:hypothetical protein
MGVQTVTDFRSAFGLVDVLSLPLFALIIIRSAQITVARSHRQINFVWWHLMLVDPQCGTCSSATILVPGIFICLLHFWKICGLLYSSLVEILQEI